MRHKTASRRVATKIGESHVTCAREVRCVTCVRSDSVGRRVLWRVPLSVCQTRVCVWLARDAVLHSPVRDPRGFAVHSGRNKLRYPVQHVLEGCTLAHRRRATTKAHTTRVRVVVHAEKLKNGWTTQFTLITSIEACIPNTEGARE